MIVSFADRDTEKLHSDIRVKRLEAIEHAARKKLLILEAAKSLDDLRVLPGNRLESLSGDRKGQYSIRINQQYRICFVWSKGNAAHVEIVDYH